MKDIVEAAIRDIEESGQNHNLQPCIISSQNIDVTKIVEITSYQVHSSWAGNLKKLIEDGFIIFRIQTELTGTGHITMAYLAKFKK
jgi:hypothetical protein